MLRPQPTRLTLKQEDLKEYEEARLAWTRAQQLQQENSTETTSKNNIHNEERQTDRRKMIQSRIGLTK